MSNTVSTSTENPELTSEAVASHEEAMIAKAEGAEAKSLEKDLDQFGNEPQEELLAGKYKTPEELEKAYKELEAKLGNSKETEETKDTEESTEPEDVPQTKEEAEAKVEEAGLDFSKLNDEYAQAGELSEDTYKALEAKGIDKKTVDAYIAGQEALAQQEVAKLHQSVGGEEEFTSMIEWAADNLSDADKAKFNKAVENPDVAEFAIQGLYAKYRADAGPNFVTGSTTSSTSGYQSQREMMKDMASPQYRTDPAYRKAVEQKIARSKF